MNPFLRYLADKHSAHRHTDTQTDRHTPMTNSGLRRAGNDNNTYYTTTTTTIKTTAAAARLISLMECYSTIQL